MKIPLWLFAHIGVAIIWGSSYALIEVALTGFNADEISILRLAIGGITVATIAAITGTFSALRKLRAWPMAIVAATTGLGFLLTAIGQMHTTSMAAGLINACVPLWTTLFVALIIPDERPGMRSLLGIGIGLVGLLVLVEAWQIAAGGTDTIGVLCVVGATLCYGLGAAIARRAFADTSASNAQLSSIQLISAAMLTSIALPIVPDATASNPTIGSFIAVVLLGIISSGLAFIMFWYVRNQTGAINASTVYYAIPVVACTVGVFFMGESLEIAQIVGGVLVVLGIVVTARREAQTIEPTDHIEVSTDGVTISTEDNEIELLTK